MEVDAGSMSCFVKITLKGLSDLGDKINYWVKLESWLEASTMS